MSPGTTLDWNDDRFHIRFFYAHSTVDVNYTVGDAHYEEWTYCGHAVPEDSSQQGSGFDKGKKKLRDKMSAGGHYVTSTHWGNTRSFKQCQGKWASSNGTVWWAWID